MPKTPRKRVANFTSYEKALIKHLIERRPIIEDKSTGGKSIAKKQVAWDSLTKAFNSNANVHKRETISLKRAWDNMKAYMRKDHEQKVNLLKKNDGQHPSTLNNASGSMEEEAEIKCEIQDANDFDDPLSKTCNTEDTKEQLDVTENINRDFSPVPSNTSESLDREENLKSDENMTFEVQENSRAHCRSFQNEFTHCKGPMQQPGDYIRREAMIRINHLEHKKQIEMQILETQLQVEEIRKRTALMEEERSKVLLGKAILELQELKKSNEVLTLPPDNISLK